ncbi:MAG: HNH endonuclease signature motif containing protein [Nibricoccus sp.]
MTLRTLEEIKPIEEFKVENVEKFSDADLKKSLATIFGLSDFEGTIKKLRDKNLWLLSDSSARFPAKLPPRMPVPIAPAPAKTSAGGGIASPCPKENTKTISPEEMAELQKKSAAAEPRTMSTGIVYEPETTTYTGNLRGENVELKDVEVREFQYTKREDADREQLRSDFGNSDREKFLKDLANDPEKVAELKKAGLTDKQIGAMKFGDSPKGYQVHHKLPIDDGGTNSQSNLCLVKNEPYHKAITNSQTSQTRDMVAGETKTVEMPIPPSFIYPR